MVSANVGMFDVTAAAQRHFYQFGKLAGGVDVFSDGLPRGSASMRDMNTSSPGSERSFKSATTWYVPKTTPMCDVCTPGTDGAIGSASTSGARLRSALTDSARRVRSKSASGTDFDMQSTDDRRAIANVN